METYVVQIWTPPDEEASSPRDLRGFVEHVGSGRREPFRAVAELIAFFKADQERQPAELDP
jgi:hypothetical protein